jgi:hypothetical protein
MITSGRDLNPAKLDRGAEIAGRRGISPACLSLDIGQRNRARRRPWVGAGLGLRRGYPGLLPAAAQGLEGLRGGRVDGADGQARLPESSAAGPWPGHTPGPGTASRSPAYLGYGPVFDEPSATSRPCLRRPERARPLEVARSGRRRPQHRPVRLSSGPGTVRPGVHGRRCRGPLMCVG